MEAEGLNRLYFHSGIWLIVEHFGPIRYWLGIICKLLM